jgi:hypothetical protein
MFSNKHKQLLQSPQSPLRATKEYRIIKRRKERKKKSVCFDFSLKGRKEGEKKKVNVVNFSAVVPPAIIPGWD